MGDAINLKVIDDDIIRLIDSEASMPLVPLTVEDVRIEKVYPSPYTGETRVVPKVGEDQTLPTKDKSVAVDIVVEEVPVSVVSSPTGGAVYYIGIKL